jgi:hypothetical protein
VRGEGTKNFYPNLSPLFYPCSSVFIYVQFGYLRNSLAAIGTIPEARGDRLAAPGAGLGWAEFNGAHVGMSGFIEDPAAAAAFQEGLSPLDGNQGNEEKTDVMVQALKPGRG